MAKQKLTDKQSMFVKAGEYWFKHWVIKYDSPTGDHKEFFGLEEE